ncbi:hypothetical protein Syun_010258 [Stephania yunnanensis]|uniref:Uncharacterized protein n=1 Tax=Stephania yunnanensis TaxID=152371 RepID=A0AAP0KIA9_9MAGN
MEAERTPARSGRSLGQIWSSDRIWPKERSDRLNDRIWPKETSDRLSRPDLVERPDLAEREVRSSRERERNGRKRRMAMREGAPARGEESGAGGSRGARGGWSDNARLCGRRGSSVGDDAAGADDGQQTRRWRLGRSIYAISGGWRRLWRWKWWRRERDERNKRG